jgi:hypothetical protein
MATHSFEIELELDGTYRPYRPATHWDPAEGGEVEDVEITDAGVLVADRSRKPGDPLRWVRKSFLTGVDLKNPEVVKLLSNLLELVREDAEAAVADDYHERAA